MGGTSIRKVSSPVILMAGIFAGLSVNISGSLLTIVAIMLIAAWATNNPLSFRVDSVFVVSSLMAVWLGLTVLWSANDQAFQSVSTQISVIAIFLVIRDLIRTQKHLQVVAEGYLLGVTISVFRLLFTGYSENAYDEMSRLTLEAFNANYLGYSYAGAVALNVAIYKSTSKRFRWLRCFSIAMSIGGMVLTDTRGAQLAVVLLVLWLITSWILPQPPIRLLLVVVGFSAVATSFGLIERFLRLLDFGSRSTGDLSGRFALWEAALDIWLENPFFGAGSLGTISSEKLGINAHNVFLETAANTGLVGLTLLVILLFVSLRPPRERILSSSGKLILGSFVVISAPIYLSGAWGWALPAWILIALFSRASFWGSDPPISRIMKSTRTHLEP